MDVLPRFQRRDLFQVPDYFNNITMQPLPGGIRVIDQYPTDQGFPELIAHLATHGYRLRLPRAWETPCDYTLVNGSVEAHTDAGNGLVALCLVDTFGTVHSSNDYYGTDYNYEAQLITRNGTANMHLGGVVVFNSNREHAWLSGNRCVLASVFVSKLRTRAT